MIYQQYSIATLVQDHNFTIVKQAIWPIIIWRKNKTNFESKEVETSGPGFWNSLPKETKEIIS